jgi:type IV pilus assembly protein PilY1
MFPVPGGVALLDVGDPRMSLRDVDGYFDTATWGDMGGQLWVARFHTPGVLDGSNHVTNWTAARAFEQQRRTDNNQYITANGASTPPNETRGSFFFMTSNVFEPTTRTVRTFAGSGSREAMLVQDVACGPNNVLGCCQAGCSSVQTRTVDTWGSCTSTQTFTCDAGKISHTSTFSTCSPTATCSATSATAVTSTSTFQATCGTFTSPTITAKLQCNESGVCSTYTPFGQNQSIARNFLNDPQTHNRFYGVWTFGKASGKMFDLYTDRPSATTVLADAKTFDTNRFTDVTYSGTCAGPTGTSGTCQVKDVTQAVGQYDVNDLTGAVTAHCLDGSSKCWAAPSDAGWYYEYGRVCPTESCSTSPPWEDEKTSSGGTIVFGCSIWTGFRPIGSSGGVNPCDNSLGTPSFYQYGANAVTGVPTRSCGYDPGEGLVYRAAAPLRTFAPPTEPKIRVAVNNKGEVSYSALDVGSPGTAPSNRQVKTRKELAEPIYWLEVPRDLHTCRHTDPTSCK